MKKINPSTTLEGYGKRSRTIKKTIKKIKDLDYVLMQKTQEKMDSLTKPQGSLGRLEELAKQVVGITGKINPLIKNKVIFTLASDHGVTEEKVSAYPKEVTAQMVYNFLNGGAGINVLARHIDARVVVVDMGVAEKISATKSATRHGGLADFCGERGGSAKYFGGENFKDRKINFGTKNFTKGPAMTKQEAIKSIERGIELVEEEISRGIDIIGTGDMGIGNTTASTALAAAFINKSIEKLTGRGTGIDDVTFKNKVNVIKKALEINRPDASDPVDVLAKVGGFEIGGLAGIILSAVANRIPVVIDGFISGAACLLAYKLEPKIKKYVIPSHCSAERGHRIILDYLSLRPLLDLNMRLGEGSGACLGINLIEAAVKILTQMATFKEATVSEKIK